MSLCDSIKTDDECLNNIKYSSSEHDQLSTCNTSEDWTNYNTT